jgi:uncharacterized protein involved in cysteine biosynthesis
MSRPSISPCPTCGYDSPADSCHHCGRGEGPPRSAMTKPPVGAAGGVVVGMTALFKGLGILLGTRGIKRLLLPPLALTTAVFIGAIYYGQGFLTGWLDSSLGPDGESVTLSTWDEGWWRASIEWLLNEGFGLAVMRGSSWVLFALLSWALAWYCFSLVYEALAGPFLDEVQGKLEELWFGVDPRAAIERPTELASSICAKNSWILGLVGGLLAWGTFASLDGALALLAIPVFAVPFLLAMSPAGLPGMREAREYSVWLRWILTIETRALWVGVEIAIITLVLLVMLLPVNLFPILGPFMYSGMVGFGTAIGMLEIPMERRSWPLSMRMTFLRRNLIPVTIFGATVGLVFTIPLLGPVVAVPAASIGGLWLVLRLDKGFLRG